jgi:hypothetical protein
MPRLLIFISDQDLKAELGTELWDGSIGVSDFNQSVVVAVPIDCLMSVR